MPSRRKPTSTRQKKAEQKLKRAIKRGDAPPPDPKPVTRHRPRDQAAKFRAAQVDSVRRLQSAFIKLSPNFLEETKSIASAVPLARPISGSAAVYDVKHGQEVLPPLTCPRRPKWRFDMTKKEVEHNEEGLFKKWLEQTDEHFRTWQESDTIVQMAGTPQAYPRSPSYFERNLEVWRQLWRVSEICQILLVLLDSRCPVIHYPPSLDDYLAKRKVIFVLTKVDITGPVCVKAWIDYLSLRYPATRVVQVESYIEKETTTDQGHSRSEPHIPAEFRDTLVGAIRSAHSELLEPPPDVRANPSRLASWKPPVKRDIDWELVKNVQAYKDDKTESQSVPQSSEHAEDEQDEPEYLTVGLIGGQPNVGKSSLLNALFGQHKVKASKTPGKTKHFQTLFWTQDIRLVDCPGLVMPSYIPMELQALCGILPISRISAVPACIHFVSRLLPLERVFNLSYPGESAESIEDKRTWREGMTLARSASKPCSWTAMDILIAYANLKGWVTAKAARPDIHRAGNFILRLLAEGKIAWAFWPPGSEEADIVKENGDGNGIWIPRGNAVDEGTDVDSDGQEHNVDSEEDENVEEVDEEHPLQTVKSRFEALEVDGEDSESGETTN